MKIVLVLLCGVLGCASITGLFETKAYEQTPPKFIEGKALMFCIEDFSKQRRCCLYQHQLGLDCTMFCVEKDDVEWGRQDFRCPMSVD